MKTFSIYAPSENAADPNAIETEFISDGNSFLAAFVPPVWLVWKQLWWAFGIYVAIIGLVIALAFTPFAQASPFLAALPGLFLFLEGNALLQQRAQLKGWRFLGVVQAQNAEEAELRYFSAYENGIDQPHITPSKPNTNAVPDPNIQQPRKQQSIGLFPIEN